MIRALYVAGSGMQAQQTQMDVVANNLANVNTTGYKQVRAGFQDLLYEQLEAGAGERTNRVQVGNGVHVAGTQRVFTGGNMNATGGPLDLAIEGSGFFRLRRADGTEVYSRDGSFHLDGAGRLVNGAGHLVSDINGDPFTVPMGGNQVEVASDGTVRYFDPNTKESVELGRLSLVGFHNPSGLLAMGGNAYLATAVSGQAVAGHPGEGGLGSLRSGVLESSNVEMVNEMVNLITAQRVYELNAKALQSADEMLQLANNLRR